MDDQEEEYLKSSERVAKQRYLKEEILEMNYDPD